MPRTKRKQGGAAAASEAGQPTGWDGGELAEPPRGTTPPGTRIAPPESQALLSDVGARIFGYMMRDVATKGLFARIVGEEARHQLGGRGFGPTVATYVAARIAMRSPAGAAVVGAGLLAKTLYDRHTAAKERDAKGRVVYRSKPKKRRGGKRGGGNV